jgi:hypothetical protein
MYQVFCLKGTPPVTAEEQDRCFRSKTCCWRLANKNKQNKTAKETEATTETPVSSH